MNTVASHRPPWGYARSRLANMFLLIGLALPAVASAQALDLINGEVTQKVALSDLRNISDTTFTLYDPFQRREVEMQGIEFRTFLIDHFGEVPPALHFTAWDEHEVTLDGWDDPNWYLITTEDGNPLTLSSRGPLRLVERDYVVQGGGDPDVENLSEFTDWIWMIRSIEARW